MNLGSSTRYDSFWMKIFNSITNETIWHLKSNFHRNFALNDTEIYRTVVILLYECIDHFTKNSSSPHTRKILRLENLTRKRRRRKIHRKFSQKGKIEFFSLFPLDIVQFLNRCSVADFIRCHRCCTQMVFNQELRWLSALFSLNSVSNFDAFSSWCCENFPLFPTIERVGH